MVAPGSIPQTLAPRIRGAGRDILFGPVRFTLAETLSMVEQGILPEDSTIELLEGMLVYRDRFDLREGEAVEGVKHNFVIAALGDLNTSLKNEHRHLRTQSTLVCSEIHAPVPDAMVLRGTRDDYRDALPKAADVLCVIEVADSSYERDSGEKLRAYAKAAIPQYVIINLRTRAAEIYSRPDPTASAYSNLQIVPETQELQFRVGNDEFIPFGMSQLLP